MAEGPDNTAVRVALWRALHVEADSAPHLLVDVVGLKLAAPEPGWKERPDMSPFTRPFRASIVGRARFVEDLVVENAAKGVAQYVILGAGLDTFAQRRPDVPVTVFEIDRPATQAWKKKRLEELKLNSGSLVMVPVDFEKGDDWLERLAAAGFDKSRPAVVAAMGVSMYLTRDAVMGMLRKTASLAKGSTFVMSFMPPLDMIDPSIRVGVERAAAGAKAAGTPWLSFFTPDEIKNLGTAAGFPSVRHVSADELAMTYFKNRPDGLRPPPDSEALLVAST